MLISGLSIVDKADFLSPAYFRISSFPLASNLSFLGWPITRVESSVAVIDETVRAVIKYMSVTGYTQDTNLRITISNFLGWNTGNHRILNGSKRILPYTKRIHERILFFLG